MFLKLLSIEWTRLSHRAMLWVTLAVCALYTGLSLANFYGSNPVELSDGTLKMPGIAFDLATPLDQMLILIPFLVIVAGTMLGNDYSQRTNQHWLMRASRASSLLARFSLLSLLTLGLQFLTILVGALVGFYYKTYIYHVPDSLNINWLATIAAPFYMTLTNLPYIALTLLFATAVRSTFFSIALGLGYTQILENLLAGIFHGAGWTKWLFTNLYFSATFLLNSIGSRAVELPTTILSPGLALLTSAAYTLIFLAFAIWLYRRQDVGG